MLKNLLFLVCFLFVIVMTSCSSIPQSDFDNLLTEYNKALEEKQELELKCSDLIQQVEHIEQELETAKEELINTKAQLEEAKSALQSERDKEAYILKPPATLPNEMTLEPYGQRVWRYLDEKRNYHLGIEIKQFEESPNTARAAPWFTIEILDGMKVHIPRQEAWELYKIMNNLKYQEKSLFDKLVQLGCIPYGSKFIPEEWRKNEYFHWDAISPECLVWRELNIELADGKWIAKKYLEMIKRESVILYDIIMTEGYEAYENALLGKG